ncbi:TPA: hypothetical protein ACGD7D_004602 [Escherichia coli]
MSKNFFQSGAFLGNGLSRFALNSDPVQLMESARASAEPTTDPVINNNPEPAAQTNDNAPSATAPEQILEGKDGKEWTVEQAHQMILEAANRSAMQNALSDAADAVFAWADSGDLTFDSLDGFVQAIAGISDDDDSEVTEEQDDAYNEAWANVADFLAACGVDDDLIEALADDEDDDAAVDVGASIAGLDSDDRDELEAAFVVAGTSDEMLTESFKKVVRNGEIKLIRKKDFIWGTITLRETVNLLRAAILPTRPKANDWYLLNSSSLLQAMKISAYWFARRKSLK